MTDNTVQLIHRTLAGEEDAFTELVQKYQKRIHALAWRKVGDYHIAEELTQDIFLQIYENLPTLKNPKLFDGWLYVISNRVCLNWIKKNKAERDKLKIQSFEDTAENEIVDSFISHHEIEQRETEKAERYQEVVKKLLELLPESERTVITLYYLGEMTAQDISKFLGVSVNTIKSRLRRGRNRLKSEEELLITDNLGSIQLSTDLTESIMKQIADIKPTAPVGKPILPWAALGTAAVLVLLLIGAMDQYIAHFQKPYDFAARSEPTIEIVESPIKIEVIPLPDMPNRIGRGISKSHNEGVGTNNSDEGIASNVKDNPFNPNAVQYTQADGPEGSKMFNIFATSDNTIHAVSETSIYRLTEDGSIWMNISPSIPIDTHKVRITEHQGVLYAINTNEILTSNNGGKTWNTLCSRPDGEAVGLIAKGNSKDKFTMYLALQDEGVFKSDNIGRSWESFNIGLKDLKITVIESVGDSVFIGTTRGLHRLELGVWRQIPLDELNTVHSIAVYENNMYVLTGRDFVSPVVLKRNSPEQRYQRIFHSTDLGSSWNEITPKDIGFDKGPVLDGATKISAVDKTLLVLGVKAFRSIDGGQSWTNLGIDMNHLTPDRAPVLARNEKTFYKVGYLGLTRSTDSGDTWHPFTNGMIRTQVEDIIVLNNKLYVYTGSGFYQSTDTGKSWDQVHIDYGEFAPRIEVNRTYLTYAKLTTADDDLYGIICQEDELRVLRLRSSDSTFSIVNRIATTPLLLKGSKRATKINLTDLNVEMLKAGGFAINGETLYIEYKHRLLKGTLGRQNVTDTGFVDPTLIKDRKDRGFKIAVSSEVVYIGKRDGRLHQSIDGGNSWKDITLTIPTSFSSIEDITFVGSAVYIATEKGVLTSETGEHWKMLTDNSGASIVIDRFAIEGSSFYGAGETGVYRIDSHGRWEQVSGNVPDKVISMSASEDKLYIGTKNRGIYYISI